MFSSRNCVGTAPSLVIDTRLTYDFPSGAGLGGLILALFLQKDCPSFRVDIYESTQELTELGAGIGFFPRVWEILRYLDLEEDLLKLAGIRGAYEER